MAPAAMLALVDAVLTAEALADFAVVENALARARDGLLAGEGAQPDDPLPDAFRAASALNAAAFTLRAGIADWLRAAGLARPRRASGRWRTATSGSATSTWPQAISPASRG